MHATQDGNMLLFPLPKSPKGMVHRVSIKEPQHFTIVVSFRPVLWQNARYYLQ